MNEICKEVYEFVENHLGTYGNRHNVQFVMSPDGSIDLESPWPVGISNTSGKLKFGYRNSLNKFAEDFRITTLTQLNDITPNLLLSVFYTGSTEIICLLHSHSDYYQIFTKRGNQIIAIDNDEKETETQKPLKTPEQFITFTTYRYLASTSN